RWARGQYLSAMAAGEPWAPISVPVRAPVAADIIGRLDVVRRWLAKWERDCRGPGPEGKPRLRTEYRSVSSRMVGTNQLPVRAWVDTPEQLCELIGTTADRQALEEVCALTDAALPALRGWVSGHPLVAIANRDIWGLVLAALNWVTTRDTSRLYLRQLDIAGVDSKFVERNYKLFEQLLSVIAPERVKPEAPDPARRLGFMGKPEYVRLRFLCPQASWPYGVSEVRLRGREIPVAQINASTVFIIENEVTYLAFPDVADSIVMFGSGYALEPANAGDWLSSRELVYWGDIDTHGLAILNNLRQRYPKVASILMDTATLLRHHGQWSNELAPTSRAVHNLTPDESALYRDLVEDRYGRGVRLEQEKVRFSLVAEALSPWTSYS
ncbi:MAG TPA: Wadjet anti-phage system protein JetD domain-containing protein, partial [Acidimicrobiales bacterium]|nr:Wadjet anti-phage system protein JetD domain-containing protein [Acidimicrobiales bacterium]